MKIRILDPVAGLSRPWPNGYQEPYAYGPGELVKVDERQGQAWIAAGTAKKAN